MLMRGKQKCKPFCSIAFLKHAWGKKKRKKKKAKGSTGNSVYLLSAPPAETTGIKEILLTDCFRQCFRVEEGARRSQGGG